MPTQNDGRRASSRKAAKKSVSGAKAKAKNRSTAVSQSVKVNIGSGKTGLRNRFSRPAYTMPSFGGGGAGGSSSVHVSIPHPLPSYDTQAGYSMHQLSSNVDNLVRYLQQQGAQPVPGPSSEAIAQTAVMGTQTDSPPAGMGPTAGGLPRGASEDLRNLDLFANMPSAPVTVPRKSEGGTQTDPDMSVKPEPPSVGPHRRGSVSRPAMADAGTDPIEFPSAPPMPSPTTSSFGTDPIEFPSAPPMPPPTTNSIGTQTMLGQSVGTNTDPLHFNVGDRSRNLPPRPERMDVDLARRPASKRKSDSTHEGLTGNVGRPDFANVRAQAPNGRGTRPHPFEELAGRYPFAYARSYRFDAPHPDPEVRFNFADNERPNAKRKRDESFGPGSGSAGFHDAPQGGVRKMARVGRRPRRNEGQILRDENALRAAMGH